MAQVGLQSIFNKKMFDWFSNSSKSENINNGLSIAEIESIVVIIIILLVVVAVVIYYIIKYNNQRTRALVNDIVRLRQV